MCWRAGVVIIVLFTRRFTLLQSLDFTAVNPRSAILCTQYFMLKILQWHAKGCSLSWEYCLSDYLIAFSIQGRGMAHYWALVQKHLALSICCGKLHAQLVVCPRRRKGARSNKDTALGYMGFQRWCLHQATTALWGFTARSILASCWIFIALFNHCCWKSNWKCHLFYRY